MIKTVTVTNYVGDSITIDMRNPRNSLIPEGYEFLISNIEGLDPPNASINISNMATGDGGYFNSARLNTRNIILTIIPVDEPPVDWEKENGEWKWVRKTSPRTYPDIQSARRAIYKYFPVKKPVTLLFDTDSKDISGRYIKASINGYVEDDNASIFGTTLASSQISIVCPDPYFHSIVSDELEFTYGVKPNIFFGSNLRISDLEDYMDNDEHDADGASPGAFPFGGIYLNRTPVLRNKGFVFCKRIDAESSSTGIFGYDGDTDTGVIVYLRIVGGSPGNITVANATDNTTMTIDVEKIRYLTGHALMPDDVVIIDTHRGKKSVTLYRNGVYLNVLGCLSRNSDWITLKQGPNIMSFSAASGQQYVKVTFESEMLYEGL